VDILVWYQTFARVSFAQHFSFNPAPDPRGVFCVRIMTYCIARYARVNEVVRPAASSLTRHGHCRQLLQLLRTWSKLLRFQPPTASNHVRRRSAPPSCALEIHTHALAEFHRCVTGRKLRRTTETRRVLTFERARFRHRVSNSSIV